VVRADARRRDPSRKWGPRARTRPRGVPSGIGRGRAPLDSSGIGRHALPPQLQAHDEIPRPQPERGYGNGIRAGYRPSIHHCWSGLRGAGRRAATAPTPMPLLLLGRTRQISVSYGRGPRILGPHVIKRSGGWESAWAGVERHRPASGNERHPSPPQLQAPQRLQRHKHQAGGMPCCWSGIRADTRPSQHYSWSGFARCSP
jgi:hypothetical protein